MNSRISIALDDFKKLDLRVGRITAAERIDGSDKLLKLTVDFGELGARQIIAGLARHYAASALTNTEAVFVLNLESRIILGLESQGMILAADGQDGPVIIRPEKDTPAGSIIK